MRASVGRSRRSSWPEDTGLTVYDGLYLALAAAYSCRVVTADRGLHEASHRRKTHLVDWVGEIR